MGIETFISEEKLPKLVRQLLSMKREQLVGKLIRILEPNTGYPAKNPLEYVVHVDAGTIAFIVNIGFTAAFDSKLLTFVCLINESLLLLRDFDYEVLESK